MGSYYSDLHDKELLSQAESIFAELTRRRLLEVRVPCNGYSIDDADIVRCSVSSAERKGNIFSLLVDRHFERSSSLRPEQRADAAAGGENG
jgi:hypothetical protein